MTSVGFKVEKNQKTLNGETLTTIWGLKIYTFFKLHCDSEYLIVANQSSHIKAYPISHFQIEMSNFMPQLHNEELQNGSLPRGTLILAYHIWLGRGNV